MAAVLPNSMPLYLRSLSMDLNACVFVAAVGSVCGNGQAAVYYAMVVLLYVYLREPSVDSDSNGTVLH